MILDHSHAGAADAFEHRYRENPDPWNFAASHYERGRYRTLVDALTRPAYASAFEPGCSVGELTAELARICGHVLATDIAPSAVESARRRCAGLGNVAIRCADVSAEVPPGPYDLVVFSEIGYYFDPPRLVSIACEIADNLSIGGEFVAAHWLGHSVDHVLHGDAVHAHLLANLPLRWLRGERHCGFRLDLWRRT